MMKSKNIIIKKRMETIEKNNQKNLIKKLDINNINCFLINNKQEKTDKLNENKPKQIKNIQTSNKNTNVYKILPIIRTKSSNNGKMSLKDYKVNKKHKIYFCYSST